MTLRVVGVSHRTAPIHVRERFHFSGEEVEPVLDRLAGGTAVDECVVLSTCNRTEFYLYGGGEAASDAAEAAMAEHAGLEPSAALEYLYRREGRGSVEHLFRVASGLDSLVVGEAEIQGQVGDAYREAKERVPESVGPILHRLFQRALAVGGRVRDATGVAEGTASVPSAAVHLAEKVFGSLEGRKTMVLGAGEMGRLTVRALSDRGARAPVVASRSLGTARDLARETDGRPVSLGEHEPYLSEVDLLVTCTGSRGPLIGARELRERRRGVGRPLVILDIAVPRDVEAAAGELELVFLYNVDDLQQVVASAEEARREELPTAERLIGRGVEDFWGWYQEREAVPLIRKLRSRAERIREREIEEALSTLDSLTEEEKERVRAASRLVLRQVLHDPTVGLRELAARRNGTEYLEVARELLGLGGGGSGESERRGSAEKRVEPGGEPGLEEREEDGG